MCESLKIVYFISSALKYVPHVIRTIFFVRCILKVSRIGIVLRAGSLFSRTNAAKCQVSRAKSQFSAQLKFCRTQNDTEKANFRCTADKKLSFIVFKVKVSIYQVNIFRLLYVYIYLICKLLILNTVFENIFSHDKLY